MAMELARARAARPWALFVTFLLSVFFVAGCGGRTRWPAHAVPGGVATPEYHATSEAVKVLRDGGNAIDAAVCAGFVLAVTHPIAGNLGGGGFMLVHTAQEDAVIDAREVAPRAARPNMYLDERGDPIPDASLIGPRATGVPGSVAGYLVAHERFGKLPRERLLEPAIRLAAKGFVVDSALAAQLRKYRDHLARFPETAQVYLPGGKPPMKGETLRQPGLARVLRAIALDGAKGFYYGWFAEELQRVASKYGARLTIGDLATYQPKMREPLRGQYGGATVLTMPPPSSGGVVLLQMLGMMEMAQWEAMRPTQRLHFLAEAGRRSFADRSLYFGDPDFVRVPVAELLDRAYVRERLATIDLGRATPSSAVSGGLSSGAESEETCHFSILDAHGNAVSCTTTLNGAFGCGLAVSGVLLNNEMDDFTTKPGMPNQFGLIQSAKNEIRPGKRPLSSMTPTILLENGKPRLLVGSPGGPTIISTVCQVIGRHIGLGQDLREAVSAPRIHHQWSPDVVLYERLTDSQKDALLALGHTLRKKDGPMGDVQAVARQGNATVAVSDPRGRGASAP